METVSTGDEGLPGTTIKGDGNCGCGSIPCSEEICMCKYTVGTIIQDMSIGDMNENKKTPGLPHNKTSSRQVMKQQLKELLIRSDMIIENSIRLQILSEKLLLNSIQMRDLCVIVEGKESVPESKECMPQENDSRAHQVDSRTQETTP